MFCEKNFRRQSYNWIWRSLILRIAFILSYRIRTREHPHRSAQFYSGARCAVLDVPHLEWLRLTGRHIPSYKRTCIHSLVLVVEREDSNGRFTDSKLLVLLVPYVSVPNYDFSAPFIATTCINERIQHYTLYSYFCQGNCIT